MNSQKLVLLMLWLAVLAVSAKVHAYEINNHADMSETAIGRSVLGIDIGPAGKLARLGLKNLRLNSDKQTFPLDNSLGPIPYCFGSERPVPFKVTTWANPAQIAGEEGKQPNWTLVGAPLTITQMIRYGACYEDESEPNKRSLAHFYNPQDGGAALTVAGIVPAGPSSLHWTLQRNFLTTALTGTNHYTWMDARDTFYKALTTNVVANPPTQNNYERNLQWGKTFQALGHIVHHLQDMGSPQHVRNDSHCNESVCSYFGAYRPSGYETYFENQFRIVKGLAESATAPIIFGLPREFWNMNTDDSLNTTNPLDYMREDQGMAAYTATNFTSVGKDFRGFSYYTSSPQYFSASGLALPRPSGQFKDVNVTQLFPPENAPTLAILCGGSTTNCNMRFMGTTQEPLARTSAVSIFAKQLLVPKDPNHPLAATYTGEGLFTQNYFTYTDAAGKLVPKAVQYSAGLINYFFRGEFSIRPPEEGVYGLLDGGDTNSNCKDTCGFRKIRARVTNTTAPINGSVQDMTAGTLTAVVKFSRNSCYQPDWSGDLGELGTISYAQQSGCYLGGGTEPVDEVVVSQPIEVNQLAVGSEQAFTFDFSANVIPVNSWNVQLQVVFRGTLGAEPNAVAVSTVRASAPTVLRYINEMDWIDINQNLYRTTDISSTPSLLSALTRQDCYYSDLNGPIALNPVTVFAYDANGNHIYDENGYAVGYYDWLCFPEWEAIRTNWKSQATGATLASSKLLYQGAQSVLVALGDTDTPVPFVIQYPRSYNRPSAPSVTYERSFYLRRLQWNAATPAIDGYQFWNYRGMHTSDVTSRYWKGSESTPWATWEVQKSRPPIRFAEPVPFDSIDSRYQ